MGFRRSFAARKQSVRTSISMDFLTADTPAAQKMRSRMSAIQMHIVEQEKTKDRVDKLALNKFGIERGTHAEDEKKRKKKDEEDLSSIFMAAPKTDDEPDRGKMAHLQRHLHNYASTVQRNVEFKGGKRLSFGSGEALGLDSSAMSQLSDFVKEQEKSPKKDGRGGASPGGRRASVDKGGSGGAGAPGGVASAGAGGPSAGPAASGARRGSGGSVASALGAGGALMGVKKSGSKSTAAARAWARKQYSVGHGTQHVPLWKRKRKEKSPAAKRKAALMEVVRKIRETDKEEEKKKAAPEVVWSGNRLKR